MYSVTDFQTVGAEPGRERRTGLELSLIQVTLTVGRTVKTTAIHALILVLHICTEENPQSLSFN